MTKYVALLRGIGPTNPDMRNENLRGVAEGLGFENVSTVISSGNVVFESDRTDVAALEAEMEAAWPSRLGFESATVIRSQQELSRLVDLAPFGGLGHQQTTYLLVTFSKHPLQVDFDLPYSPPDQDYRLVAATPGELFTVSDLTSRAGLGAMSWLETEFGKQLTSRTWLTVARILKRMG